ncbi:MAG TPA: hypothetical protein VN640_06485 [Sphingomicrobium sp.]|nr:hypothetical protein [Sphingomicrobium sp.]
MGAIAILLAAAAGPQPAPVGDAIYHYVRSNRDGSQIEHVVHFRPTRTRIAVYKWVEKCTTAAYVTAEMEPDLAEGRQFVAGKVAKDGSQAAFGTLTLDAKSPALTVDVTPPGSTERIQETHKLQGRRFLLYDFDFADLNTFFQEHRDAMHESFALPVIWPIAGPTVFRDYGTLHVSLGGEEVREGLKTKRFDLGVEGAKAATGAVWVDAADGHIVEAELGLPNHLGYQDFRLKLERVEPGGKTAWDALTRSQYANCPTGK